MVDINTNRRIKAWACLVIGSAFLSACTSSTSNISTKSSASRAKIDFTTPGAIDNGATSGEESFAASVYGVSASPLVATGMHVPRGGGYLKIGSPYVVKGRRYHPTETPKPVQYGRASWYGKAFHGRKTANGEIYDMNHFTAAHKTMPLPSYARVTNVKNGHSVIVRVNDRGPFSNDRVIDLSKRAAEVLDYTILGTAEVKVEYVGPAPLHGQDDDYLMASIQGLPGNPIMPLPGVNTNVLTASGSDIIAPRPHVPVSTYASQRVSNAFDMYRTEEKSLLWKRINARD